MSRKKGFTRQFPRLKRTSPILLVKYLNENVNGVNARQLTRKVGKLEKGKMDIVFLLAVLELNRW